MSSLFGIWAYGGAVYYSYRDGGVSGIRRASAGSAPLEVVPPVPEGQGYGNPFVDSSGIYHSLYDGTTNGFYQTSLTDPTERVLVTTTVYPYQAPVAFTEDSIVYMNTCSRAGAGSVQRLAKH
jgi:hypothetical protein